jgi:crotonobetainyl-CoA:carnitine CoA-transferase CaiB-like acyl-CoA transferase
MTSSPTATNTQPLTGYTVVELGGSASAPYAGFVLSELGATVIKVEKPDGGDDSRTWGPPFAEGTALLFHGFNRNKRSVVVDFSDATQVAALRRLILDQADVVVQNLRPGLVERFGLDAAGFARDKPDLVYANLSAYGATGPMKGGPGYDPILQAFSGIMSVTGEQGRPPMRVGMSILDITTGIWAALGVIAALLGKQRGAAGKTVDVSLFETGLGFMLVPVAAVLAGAAAPGRYGSGHPQIVPNRAFEASDGWLLMTAGNDNLFRRFAELVGKPEWITDPDYATNPARVAHQDTMYGLIEAMMKTRTVAEWIDGLAGAGIPCSPIHDTAQVVAHPQTAATGMVQQVEGSDLRVLGLPMRLDGERRALESPGPKLGADTAALLGPILEKMKRLG